MYKKNYIKMKQQVNSNLDSIKLLRSIDNLTIKYTNDKQRTQKTQNTN